jgi:hypothetical protein
MFWLCSFLLLNAPKVLCDSTVLQGPVPTHTMWDKLQVSGSALRHTSKQCQYHPMFTCPAAYCGTLQSSASTITLCLHANTLFTVLQVVLEYCLHEGAVDVLKWCPAIHFCLRLLTSSTTQVKIISLCLPLDASVSHFGIRDSLFLKARVLAVFWSVSTWSPARGCSEMAFSKPVVSHQWITQIVLSLRSSLATETRFIWIYT